MRINEAIRSAYELSHAAKQGSQDQAYWVGVAHGLTYCERFLPASQNLDVDEIRLPSYIKREPVHPDLKGTEP